MLFDDFWENSKYTRFNVRELNARREAYEDQGSKKTLNLSYGPKGKSLSFKKTRLSKITIRRTSKRNFSNLPLSIKDISVICSSFSTLKGDSEHRTYPSAGASYTTEIFIAIWKAEEKVLHGLHYYNPKDNTILRISSVEPWENVKKYINVETNGSPQAMVIFSTFSERATEKYSERGGRFALIEVGAAMQQLALTIANSKNLRGCAVGGLFDDYWAKEIGIKNCKISLGYIVGN